MARAALLRYQGVLALLFAVRPGQGDWATPEEVGLRSKCGVVASSSSEGSGPGFTPAMMRSAAVAGLGWHTNWAPGLDQGFTPEDYGQTRFVPQFWGTGSVQFPRVAEPSLPIMLGFNEPDQPDMGGSNIPPEAAVNLWMTRVAEARKQGFTQFVAPSIAQALPSRYTDMAGGSEWLPSFLQYCVSTAGCPETINFLGFHIYEPSCPTDPEVVRQYTMDARVGSLKKLATEFNGKGMNIRGLWLTEFAGRSDYRRLCSTQREQKGWMQAVLPMLSAEPAVVGYSWFSYGDGRSRYFNDQANLFNYQDGSLTDLGRTYFLLCTGQEPQTTPPPPSMLIGLGEGLLLSAATVILVCVVLPTCGRLLRGRQEARDVSEPLFGGGRPSAENVAAPTSA